MEFDSPSKLGVVGLGEVGITYGGIAQNLGCSIVGADANEKTRQRFERSLGCETYEDFKRMYQDDIDAVIVSTPNRYHETAALPALDAGLDLFFEKPLAHDFESAKRIVSAANESDCTCMVGYYLTYYECVEALKTFIEDGYFGEITHVDVRNLFRRGVPRRGSWYTSKEIAGGGVLQDKGSFSLHLLSYFGFPLEEIDAVTAKARSEFGHREDYTSLGMWGGQAHENIFDVEDSISAFLSFEDGKTASVEFAWAANTRNEDTIQIRGIDGGADLDLLEGELTLYGVTREEPGCLLTTEVEPDYADDVFNEDSLGDSDVDHTTFQRRALREFLERRTDGESPTHGTLDSALAVQYAIEEIYAAADAF